MTTNYYQILGVAKTSTLEQIKKVFKQLAFQFHPDRNQGSKESEEKFKEIIQAYEILSNEEKRKVYDDSIEKPIVNAASQNHSKHGNNQAYQMNWSKFFFWLVIVILSIIAISEIKPRPAFDSKD